MDDFTADQNQLLDELLMRWPTGAGYRKGGIPQSVEAIAAPLIGLGCVEHVEFTHDDQEGECLRLSPAMYALFHRAAGDKAATN